jgi:hypothetical protein
VASLSAFVAYEGATPLLHWWAITILSGLFATVYQGRTMGPIVAIVATVAIVAIIAIVAIVAIVGLLSFA